MSIEFFLGLAVIVFGMAALAWIYCAIFDFVEWWKEKERLQRESDASLVETLIEARLPPMETGNGFHDRMTEIMAPPGHYGINYEPPAGPPDDWEKRPSRPKAARMLD